MESKLDNKMNDGFRITANIKKCFEGEPYRTPLKKVHKYSYRRFQRMLTQNIKEVSKL